MNLSFGLVKTAADEAADALLAREARWLREHRRSRFLLTAPPLRLPGAVGSPATPIATV